MSSNVTQNSIHPGEPNVISTGMIQDGALTESKFANPDSVHASYMGRQALINSNFDVWQRGTSFTNPTNNITLADRYTFQINMGGTPPASIVHSRLTLTSGDIPGSFYGYRVTVDGAGSGFAGNNYYMFQQNIENGVRYLCGSGKKVTVSFYARSSIAGKKIGVIIAQFYGIVGGSGAEADMPGANFTLTSSWQRYSVTFDTVSLAGKTFGDVDFLAVRIPIMWGNTLIGPQVGDPTLQTFGGAGTIDFAQLQVCSGEVALPYNPRFPAEELELCQRYFETSYDTDVAPGTATSVGSILNATNDNTATGSTYNTVEFKELKRVAPTVTIYGTGGTINTVNDGTADRVLDAGALTEDIGQYGFNQNYTVTGAAGPARKFHFTAAAEL